MAWFREVGLKTERNADAAVGPMSCLTIIPTYPHRPDKPGAKVNHKLTFSQDIAPHNCPKRPFEPEPGRSRRLCGGNCSTVTLDGGCSLIPLAVPCSVDPLLATSSP